MSDEPKHAVVPEIRMVIDALGDPYLFVRVDMPDNSAISADKAEQVGLAIIAAAAAARVRAQVIRKQLLAGIPSEEAVELVRTLMND